MHYNTPYICSFCRRYRICPYHAGLPGMILGGKIVRFCQQCGRFQPIGDFEGNKKSCANKLQMHNAQRKRARENRQAAFKRRPRSQWSRKFTPSRTSSPEPQTPTDNKAPASPEIVISSKGFDIPVKCEASPVLSEMLVATAATAILEPAPAVTEIAATAVTPLPVLGADDGYEVGPLTLEEIDTLMEDFNSPLASEISLSILEEEERQQQQRCQRPPEALSPELVDPVVTVQPLPPAVVLNSTATYTCSPFIKHNPAQSPRLEVPMAFATTATASPFMNSGIAEDGSCNLYHVKPSNKDDVVNFRADDVAACSITEESSLESEVVAASFRLFCVPPAFLPLPILEHLKSLLEAAKG